MDEQEALEIIYEGLTGDACLPIKLSRGEGLDQKMLIQIRQAMQLLIEHWHGRPEVPKRLASAFVDLQAAMEWGRDQYGENDQDAIEDAAIELVQLAYAVLEAEPKR